MNNSWPAVRRVQVGLILRNLRRESGVKPKEIAERLDWYPSKLTKVERGDLTVSAAEVDVLLGMFGVTESEDTARLRALAKEARRRDQPARVPDWAATYVALEGAAAELKVYDTELVPTVLQTEDYARAVLSNPLDETVDPEPAVAERKTRSARLLASDGPTVWVVLGEAVLRRVVGGTKVLREQLQHLRKSAAKPNVTVQILPFSAGEHIALGSSFRLITLAEPPATFVYSEGLTGAEYMDKPVHTEAHAQAFDNLRMVAASDRQTARMLDQRVKELKQATE
ncbi:helix-turn-helix transcriptional regulator [Saccharopolyspora sp. NFXS83]|uniref:helix-turn-helix domain-containing protein n=1 Tax=Saccharopolyspora sp. NFXS83 TaxID=2993560 RepID=UPI00224AFB01|nr:helix-turn-helix transcriptional regulator [Saccharopolyspora sp. NFXS83]MCX2734054.1 helix-turn-helix transcriptional regulator [Saccharopolyspora sp. NFXS83]